MALQFVKTSYNGSVDLNKKIVRLPEPESLVVTRRKAESSRMDSLKMALAGLPMAVLSMAAVPALASNIVIGGASDGSPSNSSITVDPSSGLTAWTVNGVSQLNVQQFYYRIGSTGGQSLLSSGSTIVATNPLANQADVTYTNSTAGFTATVVYQLNAGDAPSDPSVLHETVNLQNTKASPLPLHFYKYADFNLNGQTNNQTLSITGAPPNTADQYDSSMTVTSNTVGQAASGPPSEVAASTGTTLYSSLNSGSPLTLNGPDSAGPGDVNWAFQWDESLAAKGTTGDTFQVSIPTTIQAVPEPASISVALAGGSLLLARRRRNPVAVKRD